MVDNNNFRLEMSGLTRIGVISDTHVPDRAASLHPELVRELRAARVDLVLHAGDISTKRVLDELEQVAPVYAAKGNRDWFSHPRVSNLIQMEINGKVLVLIHGHGTWVNYLWDKVWAVIVGYRYERYLKALKPYMNGANIIIFGHTHQPENRVSNGQMIINPGSASVGVNGAAPGFGILEVGKQGRIVYKWEPLKGWYLRKMVWKKGI